MAEITARQLFGRRQIYTDVSEITPDNVCEVLSRVLPQHMANSEEIEYLYKYYCGKTPILGKTKEIRPRINHKVTENRAYQIVEFKNSACFGEPVQYISRGENAEILKDIDELNEYMIENGKEAADRDMGEWMHIAGIAYRMVLPQSGEDVPPFQMYTLDPRLNFIVRRSGYRHEPVMSVTIVPRENKEPLHCIYTPNLYIEVEGQSAISKVEVHYIGSIPIVEYPANHARLGAFEIALPLLDAINELESNRLDDVQQSVNSFLALLGGTMDDETYGRLEEYKMLCLPDGVDAKYLSVALQQTDMQTLKDNLYQSVLTVCGMPSQSTESTSTSDTGVATMYRGGWAQAEARAKATEIEFKRSEKQMLQIVLRILRNTTGTALKVRDVEMKFTRRFVDDILTKVQALQGMLSAGIHPEVAVYTCGIWNDPIDVYTKSKEYMKQWELTEDEDVPEGGSGDEGTENADMEAVREAS